MPQQCLMVFLLLGINQMLVHFINQMLGATMPDSATCGRP